MPCPFSTALGYNQLLNTHSVELMAEKGDQFLTALTRKSASLRGEARKALDRKIEVLRRMIEFARSVPDDWSQHERIASRLSASELEMMNLTGDGNGSGLVSMPPDMRDRVPTSNLFQRAGYEHNPVGICHNTAASLFAAINAEIDVERMLPGATELAAAYEGAIRRSAR